MRGEPVLQFADTLGSQGAARVAAIQKSGQIVFHTVGDTGSTERACDTIQVADKMVGDFTEANPADVPAFYYHLGDVVYYFGEATYYYDQFYEPYRNYPAPILAIPGNHDGVTYPKEAVRRWLRSCVIFVQPAGAYECRLVCHVPP